MGALSRRTFVAGSVGVAGSLALGACDPRRGPWGWIGGTDLRPRRLLGALASPGSRGLVDEGLYQQRVANYLGLATSGLNPGSPTGIAAHLIRAERDPSYTWDIERVTVDGLGGVWNQIDTWQDTRDFSLMYLQWVYALGRGTTPSTKLSPPLLDAIKQRMLHNRYRYDDPNPEHRVDAQWYWSENHILILATDEYLAGQWFPDDVFTITGLTGRQSMARARTVFRCQSCGGTAPKWAGRCPSCGE